MRRKSLASGRYLIACGLVLIPNRVSPAQSAPSDRILGEIDSRSLSVVQGNVHPMAQARYDQGAVENSFRLDHITLMFKRTEDQQASLNELLDQQQDPSSRNYHLWLTPEQFASSFGLSDSDLDKVLSWLARQGFNVQETARSRTWIAFSGSAEQVEAAFHTQIHRYVVNEESHYANASEPSVPSALAGAVLGFRSLNNFRPKPRSRFKKLSLRPNFTSSVTGAHYLAPADFATIYGVNLLYRSGIDGTGQKIAVMGQTDIQISDIEAFRSASGLPSNNPKVVLIPGSPDPGTNENDVVEADLDVEWAGALAKNATIIYVNSGTANGVFDSLQYAIDQDLAPVISISYGACEQDIGTSDLSALAALAQQANSQGMTIVAPAGDAGATDCDFSANPNTPVSIATHGLAVDVPASLPYVTGVGGSEFNEGSGAYWNSTNSSSNGSAVSYIPEKAWNDTSSSNGLAAGGGGKSTYFTKPSWQTGNGVPDDGARDVPDISLSASFDHDGYLICSLGSCVSGFRASDSSLMVVGGTSAGVPAFAAVLALINQKTTSAQGNVNYVLYPLAANSTDAFHDITTGNNQVPCQAGSTDCTQGRVIGYRAGTGYDLVTGLGSLDVFNLASEWTSVSQTNGSGADFQLSVSPQRLTIARGNSGTARVKLTALNGFKGTATFTCSVPSTLSGTFCSLNPVSVTTSGTTILTVTTTAQSATDFLPAKFGGRDWWTLAFVSSVVLIIYRHKVGFHLPLCYRATCAALLGLTVASLLMLHTGCGSSGSTSGSSSSSQTGSVTVKAASGSTSHSVQVSVTAD
jgi:subtilase family serine protease